MRLGKLTTAQVAHLTGKDEDWKKHLGFVQELQKECTRRLSLAKQRVDILRPQEQWLAMPWRHICPGHIKQGCCQ